MGGKKVTGVPQSYYGSSWGSLNMRGTFVFEAPSNNRRDISLWTDRLTGAKGEVGGLLKVIQVRPLSVEDVWTESHLRRTHI